jgi:AcrR family transcriptional regulator
MLAAVARHGFVGTTVGELVSLAGVSKSTFYNNFADKQECFLATFETIVNVASEKVAVAYRSQTGLEESLEAAFRRFAQIVEEETEAASLVVVDSLSLGEAAIEHRERAFRPFERMIHQSFRREPGDEQPTDLEVRVLVAGVWTIVYRCIRSGRPGELADHLKPLVQWALSYRNSKPTPPSSPGRLPARSHRRDGADVLGWNEPPDSALSRKVLTQRERIVRAAARVAADTGYSALTIPAISASAGTSNQTFYENFDGKEQAFIAAFEELSSRALDATLGATVGLSDWPTAVLTGLHALLAHSVEEPLFARLAFFELPTAGPVALDHADAAVSRFMAFLQPEALPADLEPLPPVVIDALGGGIWAAIQREIALGDLDSLPDLAPALASVAITPLNRR